MDVELRPTGDEDLAFVVQAERDEENRPFIIVWPPERHREAIANSEIAHMIIETQNGRRPIGFVILASIRDVNGSVEFRRIVVTDKGKGYGRAAVKAVKRYAFNTLKAHRLWLDVKEQNTRARRLYESEGFQMEGILRECLRTEDGYDSLVVMSLLENEVLLQRQRNPD